MMIFSHVLGTLFSSSDFLLFSGSVAEDLRFLLIFFFSDELMGFFTRSLRGSDSVKRGTVNKMFFFRDDRVRRRT